MLRTLKDSKRSISHVGMLYKQEHMFLLCGFNCGAIDSLRVCTELFIYAGSKKMTQL